VAQLKAPFQSEADYDIPKGLNLRDEIGHIDFGPKPERRLEGGMEAVGPRLPREIVPFSFAHPKIDEMRKPQPMDESIAVVPLKSLQLARTQFDYLAKTFAASGDVVSMTICEIGSRALEAALAGSEDAGKDAGTK